VRREKLHECEAANERKEACFGSKAWLARCAS
jgi:hypothetical protein